MNLLSLIVLLCIALSYCNVAMGLASLIGFLYYVHVSQRNERLELIKMFYQMKENKDWCIVMLHTRTTYDLMNIYDITVRQYNRTNKQETKKIVGVNFTGAMYHFSFLFSGQEPEKLNL